MNNSLLDKPFFYKFFEVFRYDLLKAIAIVSLIAASIYYSNIESWKYYPQHPNKLLNK